MNHFLRALRDALLRSAPQDEGSQLKQTGSLMVRLARGARSRTTRAGFHQPEKLQTFRIKLMRHKGCAGCRSSASFRLRTFKTKRPKAKQTSGIPAREVYRLALHDPRRLCTCLPPIPPVLTSQVLANLSGAGHLPVALNGQDHAAWAALHPWA